MRELSLFSGAGGGIYGSKLLNWRTLGYVEFADYPQRVIKQRISDGIFDEAPIFGDVRTFVSDGYARKYRGMVDIVTGGFPCQPFSVAGKREASNDERDMWPATLEVIKAVKPPVVFLENVPGLLSTTVDNSSDGHIHYFGTILRDLAESGYDAKWCVLGADDVGAIHHRKRAWILAHAKKKSCDGTELEACKCSRSPTKRSGNSYISLLHPNMRSKRRQGIKQKALSRKCGIPWGEDFRSLKDLRNRPDIPEPIIWGGNDGVAERRNRTRAIGNGQVPLTMACAYEILSSEFIREELEQ